MRFTQQLRYSLCGIFDLAYHRDENPIRIEEIGRRQGIPARYLEQIFQKLRRAGLVVSKRGPGGGYLLARSPEKISLADVVVAVQGSVVRRDEREAGAKASAASGAAADPRRGVNGHEPEGSLEFISDAVERRIIEALASETIADLCREATRRGIPRTAAAPLMYEI